MKPDQSKTETSAPVSSTPLLAAVVEAQEEYIKLLVAELNDISPLAAIHGWKTTRREAGEQARAKIAAAKKAANNKLSGGDGH
jgi:hypothetical protein